MRLGLGRGLARTADLSRLRHRPEARKWRGRPTPRRCWCSICWDFVAVYGLQRMQHFLPLNPQNMAAVPPDLAHEHGRQLRHEYELAELRRRDDAELSDANARA